MKPAYLYLAVPALALLAGWASGPVGEGKSAGPSAPQPGERASRGEGRPWAADDFIRSFTEGREAGTYFIKDPLMAYLDKWTDAEVRAALDESLADPELLMGDNESAGVTHNLFRQLIGRDFTAATAWFAALPEHQKTALSATLLWNWPADHAEEGMEFVRANRLLCAGKEQRIVTHCLTDAAARGARDFLTTLRGLEKEGLETGYGDFYALNCGMVPGFTLPPGFDFPALFAPDALGFRPELYGSFTNSTFAQWQRHDREAAFRWIMENHGISSLALVSGGWGDGTDDGAWFNTKMTAMPAAQRAELLRAKLGTWAGEPVNARFAVMAARDTPIYQEVLSHGVQGLFLGKYGSCIPMIEGISEPEERIRFLEKLEFIPAQDGAGSYTDPAGVLALREKLRSWGADDARADAIMRRLEKGRGGE